MLQALKLIETNEMVDFKEFMAIAIEGVVEIEVLNLNVDDIINIINSNINSADRFANYYALLHSTTNFSYITINPVSKEATLKEEFRLTKEDATKLSVFFNLIENNTPIEVAKNILNDVDSSLFKYFHYEKAEKQLQMYYEALAYGERVLSIVNSIMRYYYMFC